MKQLKILGILSIAALLVAGCSTAPTPAVTGVPAAPTSAATTPASTGTVVPSPGEITAADSGNTYALTFTSRVSIILSQADYPQANLKVTCDPTGALGPISNLPSVPAGFYAVRYEGVLAGECTVTNGSFQVKFLVIDLQY